MFSPFRELSFNNIFIFIKYCGTFSFINSIAISRRRFFWTKIGGWKIQIYILWTNPPTRWMVIESLKLRVSCKKTFFVRQCQLRKSLYDLRACWRWIKDRLNNNRMGKQSSDLIDATPWSKRNYFINFFSKFGKMHFCQLTNILRNIYLYLPIGNKSVLNKKII